MNWYSIYELWGKKIVTEGNEAGPGQQSSIYYIWLSIESSFCPSFICHWVYYASLKTSRSFHRFWCRGQHKYRVWYYLKKRVTELIFDSNSVFLSLQLTHQSLSFSFSVEQNIPIKNLKPATVKAYDYYETGEWDSDMLSLERKKMTN